MLSNADWTSEIGFSDNAAHNNTDFIPWFLAQMKSQEKTAGTRLLDFLDLHYYFQADTSANDDAAKALRLRMTRSFWDPTYVDESWIGTDTPQNTQPNATIVQLIPRMRKLISQVYPGTKFSISEWSSTADTDITGGLVTVDSLGIFGKYQVDSATYWSDPDETGPIGLAYWLYRGYVIILRSELHVLILIIDTGCNSVALVFPSISTSSILIHWVSMRLHPAAKCLWWSSIRTQVVLLLWLYLAFPLGSTSCDTSVDKQVLRSSKQVLIAL